MCYPTSVVMLVFMKGVPSSAAVSRGDYRGQGVIIVSCFTKSPVDITVHIGATLMCLLFLSAIRVV